MRSHYHRVIEGPQGENRDEAPDPMPGEIDMRYVPRLICEHVQEILADDLPDAPKDPQSQSVRAHAAPRLSEVR